MPRLFYTGPIFLLDGSPDLENQPFLTVAEDNRVSMRTAAGKMLQVDVTEAERRRIEWAAEDVFLMCEVMASIISRQQQTIESIVAASSAAVRAASMSKRVK